MVKLKEKVIANIIMLCLIAVFSYYSYYYGMLSLNVSAGLNYNISSMIGFCIFLILDIFMLCFFAAVNLKTNIYG